MKEVKDIQVFDCKLYNKTGLNSYTLTNPQKPKEKVINQLDLEKDDLTKKYIEMLIRDILHGNSNLELYKGLFVLKNDRKDIESYKAKGSITFYPGYTTSFMETEKGNYLIY